MLKRILLGLTLFCSCLPILAQEVSDEDKDRQYVTDQLRLSLYESASSQSQVIKLLQSGDLLARIYSSERTGTAPVEYRAASNGIIMGRHYPSLVKIGDFMNVIASIVQE